MISLFLNSCLYDKEDIVLYAHPFDWYKKKADSAYSLIVNLWYLSSYQNTVKKCLYKLIEAFKDANLSFELLSNK